MVLQSGGHAPAGDIVAATRLKRDEFDRCREAVEGHGKTGRSLLPAKGLLDIGMAAVDADLVSLDVRRPEKWKPHDVIPMDMGLKNVKGIFLRRTVAAEYVVPEGAHSAPEVAKHVVVVACVELHARGIASESMRDREIEIGVDPGPRLFLRVEALARSGHYGAGELVADRSTVQGNGNRPSRSPKRNPQPHRSATSGGVVSCQRGRRNLSQGLAHRSEALEYKIEAADFEDFPHNRLKCGDDDRTFLLANFLGREHQHAQPYAADVIDLGEIKNQAIAALAAGRHVSVEVGSQPVGRAVVDPPDGGEHQRVCVTLLGYMHASGSGPI